MLTQTQSVPCCRRNGTHILAHLGSCNLDPVTRFLTTATIGLQVTVHLQNIVHTCTWQVEHWKDDFSDRCHLANVIIRTQPDGLIGRSEWNRVKQPDFGWCYSGCMNGGGWSEVHCMSDCGLSGLQDIASSGYRTQALARLLYSCYC